MEMPKPGEAHQRMQVLSGTWEGEETMMPSPWVSEETTAPARVVNRIGLAGFSLLQEYAQFMGDSEEPTFEGHAVMWYDPKSQEYGMTWFDSYGFPPHEYRGSFDGQRLVMTSKTQQGFNRSTWDLSEPDRYKNRMEVSQDGESWKIFMEGSYQRVTE